eukprot:495793_1
MASKSTNASDRTQKASKSKRKSSRRMKKSTNTPDTTQKASKSKKKDVRYQSLGTVPIFGEMNNKRSMRPLTNVILRYNKRPKLGIYNKTDKNEKAQYNNGE